MLIKYLIVYSASYCANVVALATNIRNHFERNRISNANGDSIPGAQYDIPPFNDPDMSNYHLQPIDNVPHPRVTAKKKASTSDYSKMCTYQTRIDKKRPLAPTPNESSNNDSSKCNKIVSKEEKQYEEDIQCAREVIRFLAPFMRQAGYVINDASKDDTMVRGKHDGSYDSNGNPTIIEYDEKLLPQGIDTTSPLYDMCYLHVEADALGDSHCGQR